MRFYVYCLAEQILQYFCLATMLEKSCKILLVSKSFHFRPIVLQEVWEFNNARPPVLREDHLETSNNYRIFFEVFLGVASTIFGSIISLLNEEKKAPVLNWFF
jgi:hypothetical protein